MNDLIFEVTQQADGGFVAECLTESIVTQGDSWECLREAVNEAVRGYFFDAPEKLPSALLVHAATRSEAGATHCSTGSPLAEFFGSVDRSIKDPTNAGIREVLSGRGHV
jgi:predicted RNase H-like HicB family nuclease